MIAPCLSLYCCDVLNIVTWRTWLFSAKVIRGRESYTLVKRQNLTRRKSAIGADAIGRHILTVPLTKLGINRFTLIQCTQRI